MTFFKFSITVLKIYFDPKWMKVQSLFTVLRPPFLNWTSIQLLSLFNRWLRIQSFGRGYLRDTWISPDNQSEIKFSNRIFDDIPPQMNIMITVKQLHIVVTCSH